MRTIYVLIAVSVLAGIGLTQNIYNANPFPWPLEVELNPPKTILVPEHYSTIQAAIDAAKSGFTILVAPGTYQENVFIEGKAVVLRSDEDRMFSSYDVAPEKTVIDGDRCGDVMRCYDIKLPGASIEGFTITNSHVTATGVVCSSSRILLKKNIITSNNYGIFSGHDSDSNIEDNIIDNNFSTGIICNSGTITGNTVSYNFADGIRCIGKDSITTVQDNDITFNGNGICCIDSAPTICNNDISENKDGIECEHSDNAIIEYNTISNNNEMGIRCESSSPLVRNNTLSENENGFYSLEDSTPILESNIVSHNINIGIGCRYHSSPIIRNNMIFGNHQYGVWCGEWTEPILTNNTITENRDPLECTLSDVIVTNSIIWNNEKNVFRSRASITITFSNVEHGYPGTGNIDSDPLFNDPNQRDYHLMMGSPCIDAGTNDALEIPVEDFEGDPRIVDGDGDLDAVVDMGADEFVM